MSDCHASEEQIEAYAMERLTKYELRHLEEHLVLCQACQRRVEVVEALRKGLRELPSVKGGLNSVS
jgi:anti-sigma factor RsiW